MNTGIAGDFLGLLAQHNLRPLSAEASSRAPEQTHSTTVFAFRFRDGVLVAGDRRATAGNIIVADDVNKIIEIDRSSVLAIAGVPAMAFEMARAMQVSFAYYRRSQLQPLSLEAKVRALARLLRENLPLTLQGVGVVAPVFATVETQGDRIVPRIYFYDPLGAQFEAVSFAASGSGSGTVRSVLSFQERFGEVKPSTMTLKQAIRFAHNVLTVASEFDAATGGVDPTRTLWPILKVLDDKGVRDVQSTEHQAAQKEGA
ncbi:MAG TPA: proteasome subunit alpha [Verrucomicrobiae bacterium]